MSFFATIKKNAKLALKGNWGPAMGASVVVAAISMLMVGLEHTALTLFVGNPFAHNPTMEPPPRDYALFVREMFALNWVELLITGVFVLLSLLLLSPLGLGLNRLFLSVVHGRRTSLSELFYFFETMQRYTRAVWHTVQINLRCWLWSVLFFCLPGGIMAISARFLILEEIDRQTRAAASIGMMLALGLVLLAAILYAIYVSKYALTAYLLCESDALSVRQAIKASIRYTKGYRGLLVLFPLSFIGWYLLSPLTFFLLLLYVAPYHSAATALLNRYLVEKSRQREVSSTQEWSRP